MAKKFKISTIFKGEDKLSKSISKIQRKMMKFTRMARRGLKKVDRVTSKLVRTMGKGLKVAGIAAAAGIVAAGIAIQKTTKSMDDLAKTTRRLDFDIEAFQEWKFAAAQSGVSTDKFNTSLDKFAKTIGEAKLGQGTLTTLLRRNNKPLLEQLKNTKNTSEAFEIYIEAMRKIEDPTKRVALGMLAFGRSGASMANLAGASAEEIKKLRKEMQENGVVTLDQAKAAEKYNDTINSLSMSLKGLLVEAIAPILPYLIDLGKNTRKWIIDNKELIKIKVKEFISAIINGIKRIINGITELNKKYDLLKIIGDAFRFIGEAIKFVFKHGKTIAIVAGIILTIAAAVKVLTGVLTLVNLVIAANPMVLIIAGIVTAITLAAALIIRNWDWIMENLESLKVGFIQIWDDMKAAFISVWEGIKSFFGSVWEGIKEIFDSSIGWIIFGPIGALIKAITTIKDNWSSIKSFFGFGDNAKIKVPGIDVVNKNSNDNEFYTNERQPQSSPLQMVSPSERTSRSIEERNLSTTNKSEVTIKDESGRARVTKGKLGEGLKLQESGAF